MTSHYSFSKYNKRGAYHWEQVSRSVSKHQCFTLARYFAVVDAAKVKPGERLLDVGCGDGALTYLFWQQGAICCGVDIDRLGIELASDQFRRHGASADFLLGINGISDGSQDIVVCAEVIEHVDDPESLLRDLHRVLRPTGRLVLSTPVRLNERPQDSEHVYEFFPDELANLVSQFFKIVDFRLEISSFAVQLYYWRPVFFLRLPVTKLVMNICSIFGFSILRRLKVEPLRLPMLQIIVARKR